VKPGRHVALEAVSLVYVDAALKKNIFFIFFIFYIQADPYTW